MKILIVHNLYSQPGGEDAVVKSESEMLRKAGLEVIVKYYHNPTSTLKQAFSLLVEAFNVFQYKKFQNMLKKEKPTVVHLHNWHFQASPSIVWATKSMGIPLVITIHNYRLLCPSGTLFFNNRLFLASLSEKTFISAIRHKVYHDSYLITAALSFTLLVNKFIRTWSKSDKFIFLNGFMADLFKNSYLNLRPSQIKIKPNFVENNLPHPVKCSQQRTGFLFVGRLSVEKGIEVLLEAFRDTDLTLQVIGDGPLKQKVIDTATMSPNIQYLGFQQKEAILGYMSSSEALIFPSIWYEGMPITILEAFSSGTPVIASKIGSLCELIENKVNGLHFSVGDPLHLRAKMEEWMSLPSTTKDNIYENVIRIFREKYTVDRNIHNLIEIYKEVI